jgi:hypothetical protein
MYTIKTILLILGILLLVTAIKGKNIEVIGKILRGRLLNNYKI